MFCGAVLEKGIDFLSMWPRMTLVEFVGWKNILKTEVISGKDGVKFC